MLVQEECVEVHALRRRGWSISAIARHLGRDRKTVRAYLSGERVPGQGAPGDSGPFDPFEAYVRQRLSDDPYMWASALFDEVVALGYEQSYPTFVRKIRNRDRRVAGVREPGVVLLRLLIIHRVRSARRSYLFQIGMVWSQCWYVVVSWRLWCWPLSSLERREGWIWRAAAAWVRVMWAFWRRVRR